MRCPACHYADTKVLDSRVSDTENTVRRRRACERCRFRFSTREETEILNLTVIKRDGRREAYARPKIENGLQKALEKRSITRQEFGSLLAAIERDIYVLNKPEIKTAQIGEIVMKHLRKLDEVAYIRFASVYRDFADAESFRQEIKFLTTRKRGKGKMKAASKKHGRRKRK